MGVGWIVFGFPRHRRLFGCHAHQLNGVLEWDHKKLGRLEWFYCSDTKNSRQKAPLPLLAKGLSVGDYSFNNFSSRSSNIKFAAMTPPAVFQMVSLTS